MSQNLKDGQFLSNENLSNAIGWIVKGKDVCCAVAFIGSGADKNLGADARVICNLSMGGTNPKAISALKKTAEVRQSARLHAKVYISDRGVIVTSANFSANGLGVEGEELKGWHEAGVYTRNNAEILQWFNKYWNTEAVEISTEDLKKAEDAWRLRQNFKPGIEGLSNVDAKLASERFLLAWWTQTGDEIKFNYEAVYEILGQTVKERIDENLLDLSAEDEVHSEFFRNKPVLCFEISGGGRAKKSFHWVTPAEKIEGGVTEKGDDKESYLDEKRDLWLGKFPKDHDPITLTKSDKERLAKLLNEDKYASLRDMNRDAWHPYFTEERQKLIREFWLEACNKNSISRKSI